MTTGRRGRPQRPLDTTVPALAELAQHLRELRAAAGLTLDNLSATTHWSKGALSAATTGRDLPRRELVEAWVLACDPEANLDLWRARHARARAQHQRTRIAPAKAAGAPAGAPAGPVPAAGPAAVPGARVPAAAPAGPSPVPAPRGAAEPAPGPGPGSLERDAWRTLAPDRRPWGVAAHPAAIPVRFTTVGPDFTDTDTDTATGAADLTGRYDQIAEVFALTGRRRLLILGERGSGKTQLARHLGTRLLTQDGGPGGASAGSSGAVPVLVSLRGWSPERGPDSLFAWLADALTGCSPEDVRTLLGRHRLLPLLDDFDSLTLRQRARALSIFNQLPEQAPFVLVSGWAEFTRAVEQTDTVIAGSSGVRLRPVGVGDLDGWIQRSSRSRTKEQDWAPVLAALAARPELPAAAVLADPTLAGAARLLYTDGRADPGELVAEDASAGALASRLVQHLFAVFPPYPVRGRQGAHRERHRHLALHLLARREQEEGGPVGDLRVLYRGRRPARRRAAVQAGLLGLLVWLLIGITEASSTAGGYDSGSSGTPGTPFGFFLGLLLGAGWYVYLRHRLDEPRGRTDLFGRMGLWAVRAVPPAVAALLVLGVEPDEGEPIGFCMAGAALAGAVGLAERVVRERGAEGMPGELALLPALLLVGAGPRASFVALVALVPLWLGVAVTGYWLRALFASRFALWGLYPAALAELLGEATGPEVLRSGPDGWSFNHPAVAHWYRDTADLPERDAEGA
ncbi:helix-turn-helix domain-containing protein [Streptomyces sp. NPDC032472]|uniref:helix-turn-helix domain-containing protein n=1 Tax=Streptomyces sp. NPDC032472 TaxID=3155018 RepID=UPI0033CC5E2A